MEKWKDIPGTNYSVSDQGRVGSKWFGRWRILKLNPHRQGYLLASISVNKKQIRRLAHQFVAEAFIGPRPTPKHEVNHKNGVKDDNRVENLAPLPVLRRVIRALREMG